MFKARAKTAAGVEYRIIFKKDSGMVIQGIEAGDTINYQTNDVAQTATFLGKDMAMGLVMHHAKLRAALNTIKPFTITSPAGLTKQVKMQLGQQRFALIAELLEDMAWEWRKDLNRILIGDNAASPKLPTGLFGLLSFTPTVGTYGTIPRAGMPAFQNLVRLGSTVTAGGSLGPDLRYLINELQMYNVDEPKYSGPLKIRAGREWIEGYLAYAQANGLLPERYAGGAGIDIGLGYINNKHAGIEIIHHVDWDWFSSKGYDAGYAYQLTKTAMIGPDNAFQLMMDPTYMDELTVMPGEQHDMLASRVLKIGSGTPLLMRPRLIGLSTIA
jgi:hypothetical protein